MHQPNKLNPKHHIDSVHQFYQTNTIPVNLRCPLWNKHKCP